MNTLNQEQQKDYEKRMESLSKRGIKIGEIIELWKHPSRYELGYLDPEDDLKNKRHFIKYKDQFGTFHCALLPEKHFVKITELYATPYQEYDVSVHIVGEADGMFFKTQEYTQNGEWYQFKTKEREKCEATFCTAEQAYNSRILYLYKDGKKPIPEAPIIVCSEHNFAYRKSFAFECRICSHHDENDYSKPKLNPALVSILNKDIEDIN